MICYNSTPLEQDLSILLSIPLFALNPELECWGTKSGSHHIFAECGIPHPEGSELVWNVEDLALAAAALWERQPTARRMVIKLNEGFSGQGNALLDLQPVSSVAPGSASRAERANTIYRNFTNMRFQAKNETWENFSSRIPDLGAIVEIFIEGETKLSPSVQGSIKPNGKVEIFSTHEQIMGGLDNQVYVGCSFPADPVFSIRLKEFGLQIGKNLAKKGALEDFCVDFVAVRQSSDEGEFYWELQAVEINLRKGGTTHPFRLLQSLTNGQYDFSSGLFYSQKGTPKYYVAFDKLQKDQYRGFLPSKLIDIIAEHKLHFNNSTETGCIFHLMSCLSEVGRLGFTCVGNSPQEAEEIYNKVIKTLDEQTTGVTY
ncbi:peptide ligase PGM1-related protein [Plectonema radiosum NIES-515]|uniref:Peptide ligase PGM1-related protein n=2 Tax=Plectonema TaxID=1183 RepID=A0ABT3AYJ7_9CYAN|nr:peptide ligase PGM1-related protein [Plectonema radiosum NIES-515]